MPISPRYKLLLPPAFTTYLRLSTFLINGIPLSVFKPPVTKGKKSNKTPVYKEPDSESDLETKVSVVSELLRLFPILWSVTRQIIAILRLASLISMTKSKTSLFLHVILYLFALVVVSG